MFDLKTRTLLDRVDLDVLPTTVTLLPDGRVAAAAMRLGETTRTSVLVLWEATGKPSVVELDSGVATSMAASPDGRHVAVGLTRQSGPVSFLLWDVLSQKVIAKVMAPESESARVAGIRVAW